MMLLIAFTFGSTLLAAVSALTLPNRQYLPTPSLEPSGTKDDFIGHGKRHNNVDVFNNPRSRRNAVVDPRYLWPNATIPYIIDGSIAAPRLVEMAMEHIMNKSCIKFVRWTNEKDYVKIFKGKDCSAPLGRRFNGQHSISIGAGCAFVRIIIHELLHSIGLDHEHQRSDRDKHINVYLDNIQDDFHFAFAKNDEQYWDNLEQPYDYNSIMHYGETDFSKKKPDISIKAKDPKVVVGPKDRLTELDVKKINILYSCTPEYARPTCRDDFDQCWYWAQNYGCSNYLSNMRNRCRLSCKLCESSDTVPAVTAAPTTCLDKSFNCFTWVANGGCRSNNTGENFVLEYCPRACKICHV